MYIWEPTTSIAALLDVVALKEATISAAFLSFCTVLKWLSTSAVKLES